MKSTGFWAAALLGLLPYVAAAASPQSFMITWSGRDSKTGKSAGESAASWATAMENIIGKQLDTRFPCGSTMDQDALFALLDNERKRQLLGGEPDMNLLANIGSAVGAKTVISIQVAMMGDGGVINVFAIDSVTARVLVRQMQRIPLDGQATSGMERLAAGFVNSLAASIPKCKGKDWSGSVTVEYAIKTKSPDGKSSEDGNGSLVCTLSGNGLDAKCSYSSTSTMRGPDGSATWTKTAKDADTLVSVGFISGGKLHLTISSMRVMASMNATIKDAPPISTGPNEEVFSAQSFEVPAGPDPNHQSGSFTESATGYGGKTTVSWSLSKPAAGSR